MHRLTLNGGRSEPKEEMYVASTIGGNSIPDARGNSSSGPEAQP